MIFRDKTTGMVQSLILSFKIYFKLIQLLKFLIIYLQIAFFYVEKKSEKFWKKSDCD